MTEQELLAAMVADGWTITGSQEREEDGMTQKAVRAYKIVNGLMKVEGFTYRVTTEGETFWIHHSPMSPQPPSQPTFATRLNTRITELIAADTIKAAYLERLDKRNETAIVVVVMPDDTFKTFLVRSDAQGDLQTIPLTGNYPMGASGV